jgi:hypothetical protein
MRVPRTLALVLLLGSLAAHSVAQRPSSRVPRKEVPTEEQPVDAPSSTDFPAPEVRLAEPIQPLDQQIRQGGAVTADPRAKLRTVVRILVNFERAHRDRVARLERLAAIFREAGAQAELAEVERLRALVDQRFAAAQKGYERDLGPAIYAQVRAVIDAQVGTAPRSAR